jgi:hypothetical protein
MILEFQVEESGVKVKGAGFEATVYGRVFRVEGSGFKVSGSGFRVEG